MSEYDVIGSSIVVYGTDVYPETGEAFTIGADGAVYMGLSEVPAAVATWGDIKDILVGGGTINDVTVTEGGVLYGFSVEKTASTTWHHVGTLTVNGGKASMGQRYADGGNHDLPGGIVDKLVLVDGTAYFSSGAITKATVSKGTLVLWHTAVNGGVMYGGKIVASAGGTNIINNFTQYGGTVDVRSAKLSSYHLVNGTLMLSGNGKGLSATNIVVDSGTAIFAVTSGASKANDPYLANYSNVTINGGFVSVYNQALFKGSNVMNGGTMHISAKDYTDAKYGKFYLNPQFSNFVVNGGTIALKNNINAMNMELRGGEINLSKFTFSNGFYYDGVSVSNGILNGATINGDLDFSGCGVTLDGAITVNGSVSNFVVGDDAMITVVLSDASKEYMVAGADVVNHLAISFSASGVVGGDYSLVKNYAGDGETIDVNVVGGDSFQLTVDGDEITNAYGTFRLSTDTGNLVLSAETNYHPVKIYAAGSGTALTTECDVLSGETIDGTTYVIANKLGKVTETTIAGGGIVEVLDGASADTITMGGSGRIIVSNGAVVENINGVVGAAAGSGVQFNAVINRGTIVNAEFNAYAQAIQNYGIMSNITVNTYDSNCLVNFAGGTIYNLTLNFAQWNNAGTRISAGAVVGAEVNSRALLKVFNIGAIDGDINLNNGGVFNAAKTQSVAGGHIRGNLNVLSGGIVNFGHADTTNFTIGATGKLNIYDGGDVKNSGGKDNVTFNEGEINIYGGSLALTNNITMRNNGSLNFMMQDRAGNGSVFVNDYTKFVGDFAVTITANAGTQSGTYKLIGKAATFDQTITLNIDTGSDIVSQVMEKDVTYTSEDISKKFVWTIDSSVLTLTVTDATVSPVNLYKDGVLKKSVESIIGAVLGAENEYDSMTVTIDGAATSTTINAGGSAFVTGGDVIDTTINNGRMEVTGGNVNGINGVVDYLRIGAGVTATNIDVKGDGDVSSVEVYGNVNNGYFKGGKSAARQIVFYSGASGADIKTKYTSFELRAGATITGLTIENGEQRISGAVVNAEVHGVGSAGADVGNLKLFSNGTIDGIVNVYKNGKIDLTSMNAQAETKGGNVHGTVNLQDGGFFDNYHIANRTPVIASDAIINVSEGSYIRSVDSKGFNGMRIDGTVNLIGGYMLLSLIGDGVVAVTMGDTGSINFLLEDADSNKGKRFYVTDFSAMKTSQASGLYNFTISVSTDKVQNYYLINNVEGWNMDQTFSCFVNGTEFGDIKVGDTVSGYTDGVSEYKLVINEKLGGNKELVLNAVSAEFDAVENTADGLTQSVNDGSGIAGTWNADTVADGIVAYIGTTVEDVTDSYLMINGFNDSAYTVFGGKADADTTATNHITFVDGVIGAIAGGGVATITDSVITIGGESGKTAKATVVYGGGCGGFDDADVTIKAGAEIVKGVFGGGNIKVDDATCNYITLTVDGAKIDGGNIVGGNYVNGFNNTTKGITLNLSGNTFMTGADDCVFAAGYALGGANYNVEGYVNLNISDATLDNGQKCGRGVFGGAFASGEHTVVSIGSEVNDAVNITVDNSTINGNLFGGSWAQKDAVANIENDVNITIDNSTVTNVFGGGAHGQGSNGETSVIGDINIIVKDSKIGNAESDGAIYGRGQTDGDVVIGTATITLQGTTTVGRVADKKSGNADAGATVLVMKDFTGSVTDSIKGIDSIVIEGDSAATINTVDEGVQNWFFNLSEKTSDTAFLIWDGGAFEADSTVGINLSTGNVKENIIVNFDNEGSGLFGANTDRTFDLYINNGEFMFADIRVGEQITGTGTDFDGWGLKEEDGKLMIANLA